MRFYVFSPVMPKNAQIRCAFFTTFHRRGKPFQYRSNDEILIDRKGMVLLVLIGAYDIQTAILMNVIPDSVDHSHSGKTSGMNGGMVYG